MDYKASGVDRDLADQFIEELKVKISSTNREEVESEVGDFGGFFRAPKHMKDPLFVATTDGVGTKLLLAEEAQSHRGLGQDLVAMCVNDLIACKAEPLIFLDYLATGKIEKKILQELLFGVVDACKESGCSLVGGETAEMPGFYAPSRYDVAGFSVGVLERADRMKVSDVVAGDRIFGIPSSGFHSNGYSLVRKVIEKQGWKLSQSFDGKTLQEQVLSPTRLYVRSMLDLFKKVKIKAAAHITGGGLVENLPRGVDESKVSLVLQKSKIPTQAFVRRFVEAAGLEEREAYSTWNMGIGFCFILSGEEAQRLPQGEWIEIGWVEAKTSQTPSVQLL